MEEKLRPKKESRRRVDVLVAGSTSVRPDRLRRSPLSVKMMAWPSELLKGVPGG